jgi:hypothetical protein
MTAPNALDDGLEVGQTVEVVHGRFHLATEQVGDLVA